MTVQIYCTCIHVFYELLITGMRFWRMQLILVEQEIHRSKLFDFSLKIDVFPPDLTVFNSHDITEIVLKVTLNTITLTLVDNF